MVRHHTISSDWLFWLAVVALSGMIIETAVCSDENDQGQVTEIADVQHDGEVDFEEKILPIFRRNCLACHNNVDEEGDLVLETPQAILKGGSNSPVVVAGKSAESRLLKLAALQEEPHMPPEDNEVNARPLTPDELGWIRLWIDQGAKGKVSGTSGPVNWQLLPEKVNPIYAVAVSPDGQYAAAGRGNQIFLYHVPSKREIGRLSDPSLLEQGIYKLPGIAHLDFVQSLRFSPDSQLLASGGYRIVKIWRRTRNVRKREFAATESSASSLAVSRNGKWAAFGDVSGKIKVYELVHNNLHTTLEGHGDAINGLAFSQDSSRLISGSQDKKLVVWSVTDGNQVANIDTPAPVNAVVFVSEDKQVATGGADNIIRVWAIPQENAENEVPQPVKELMGHAGPVTSLAVVTPKGGQLLSGGADQLVRVWDVATGNQVSELNHGGFVTAVAVRPDGQRYASASSNNTAKIWNAVDGKEIAELRGDFRAKIRVEDATRAVTVAELHVKANKDDLDVANKRVEAEEKNAQTAEENLQKAAEALNQKMVAVETSVADQESGRKAIADVQQLVSKHEGDKKLTEEAIHAADEMINKAQADLAAASKYINDVPAATKLAADTLDEGLKRLKEAAKGQADNRALADVIDALQQAVQQQTALIKKAGEETKAAAENAVVVAQDRKKETEFHLKKVSEDLAMTQNDVKQKEESQQQLDEAVKQAMNEMNSAEDDLHNKTRTVQRIKNIITKVVDTIPSLELACKKAEEHHKCSQEFLETVKQAATVTEKPYHAIAFSPDGLHLATGGDGQTVRTWDSDTGAAIETYSGHEAAIIAVAYNTEGDLFSAISKGTTIIWDTHPSWKLVGTIGSVDSSQQLIDRVTSLAFSPDGTMLATGSGEPSRSGELKIWKVEDESLVKEIKEAHSDTVFGLEFSPDGRQIASCGADRLAKIFDIESANMVGAFEGHTHHVLGIAWHCTGRSLATSGADNVIKIWNVTTGEQARSIGGFGKEVTAVRFVSTSDNVVVSSGDKQVKIKKSNDGGDAGDLGGATDFMYSVDVSADGHVIVGGGRDSVVRIWQGDGTSIGTFGAPKSDAESVATDVD